MGDERPGPLFYELFTGLPRQGPGDPASTRRALALVPPLGPTARVLDVGCGTGGQTLVLAAATPARITAVDNHAPFIEELRGKVQAAGLADRVEGLVGDMGRLELPDGSIDLLWAEGSIFVVGFDRGLREWRRRLKPGGHVVVSEASWWTPTPSPECADFFAQEYPAIRSTAANLEAIASCGYDLVGHFRLPAISWWTDYYTPLTANLAVFRKRHAGDAEAEALAAQIQREMDVHRRRGEEYGYDFFVMRRPSPTR
jgi:ubiquinone/menaquinone biosynthesis C-methylase UbiE